MTTADDEVTQLRSELASLRAEVAVLRHAGSRPIPTGRISRGGLLRAAGLAAAGVAAGGLAPPAATPALAGNGAAVIAGQDNQAFATTSLTSSVLTDAALRVSNYYTGVIDGYSDALQAYTYGSGLAALYGRNDAAGGSGVIGFSGDGVGGTFAGGQAPLRLQPANTAGEPTTLNHQQGELSVDANGSLWLCTASGSPTTPGSWSEVGGGGAIGAAASTLILDRSGNGAHGTLGVAAGSPRSGSGSGAAGGNGYIDVSALSVIAPKANLVLPFLSASRSIELWFKTTSSVNNTWQSMLSYGTTSTGRDVEVAVYSPTTVNISFYGDDWMSIPAGRTINDGAWHHMVFTFDGGSNVGTVYIDGASCGTYTFVPPWTMPALRGLILGSNENENDHFTGSLDEVAVYESILSATRVSAHYDAPSYGAYRSAVLADTPVLYWPFE